ncbi:MAG: hypothetical protein AAAC48_19835 [Phyllobacterium sp.]|uniref:hypothetical protein n=1 Tax=Phyllobacterium sp. TaxID=1871046 RepID=UPI0030F2B41D
MTDLNNDGKLLCLLEQHAALIIQINLLNSKNPRSDKLEGELWEMLRRESYLREQLMDLEPQSIADAQSKIIHFVGYLCATKSFLDDECLTRLLRSLRQFV